MNTLIALSGYAQTGKDTIAEILVNEKGYERRAFADVLRQMLYALNPIVGNTRRVQDMVDEFGWDKAKAEPEVRALLQRMGTEAGREVLGENVWVDFTLRNLAPKTVITDCRFPNEAMATKDRGGFVVRVERPGVVAVNEHSSDSALDDWPFDYVLPNSSSLERLRERTISMVERLEKLGTDTCRTEEASQKYWKAVADDGLFRVDL